jgi:hypothetical protein
MVRARVYVELSFPRESSTSSTPLFPDEPSRGTLSIRSTLKSVLDSTLISSDVAQNLEAIMKVDKKLKERTSGGISDLLQIGKTTSNG